MAISFPRLSAALRALIVGAIQATQFNQPLGPPQLDSDGNLPVSSIRIRTGTAAEIGATVLDVGECGWATDTRRLSIGDDSTAGGLTPAGLLTSGQAIYVDALGTPTQNAAAAIAGYTAAKALTPNGSALSTKNEAWLILGPGVYDFTGNMNWAIDTNFVNIIALSPGTAYLISSDGSNTGAIMLVTAATVKIIDLTFDTTWTDCINLRGVASCNRLLEGITATSILGIAIKPTDTGIAHNGTVFRRVTSTHLCGGVDSLTSPINSNILFEYCNNTGSRGYFGGATAAGATAFSGTIRHCINTDATNNMNFGGTMEFCLWKGPMTRLVAGARFFHNIFSHASSAFLTNNNTAVSIKAAFNVCSNALLGTNVTNSLTTSNTESAGNNLW